LFFNDFLSVDFLENIQTQLNDESCKLIDTAIKLHKC